MKPTAAMLFACFALNHAAFASEAIQTATPNVNESFVTDDGAGFAFRPRTNILITALGYQFSSNSYVTGKVEIVDAARVVLTSAIISTNSPKVNEIYYEPIAPVVIPAYSTNFVLGQDHEFFLTNFTAFWLGGLLDTNEFSVAPELDYLGAAIGTNLPISSKTNLFQGANFQFIAQPSPAGLEIRASLPNTILLIWPEEAAGYTLQSSATLDTPMTNVLQPPVLIGGVRVLALPDEGPSRFFHLVQ